MLCQCYSGTVFLYICVYVTVLFIKEEEEEEKEEARVEQRIYMYDRRLIVKNALTSREENQTKVKKKESQMSTGKRLFCK